MPSNKPPSTTAKMMGSLQITLPSQKDPVIPTTSAQPNTPSTTTKKEEKDSIWFDNPQNVVMYGENQFNLIKFNIDQSLTQDLQPKIVDPESNITFYPTLRNIPTENDPATKGIIPPPTNGELIVLLCPTIVNGQAIDIEDLLKQNQYPERPCCFVVSNELDKAEIEKLGKIFPVIKTELLNENYVSVYSPHSPSESARISSVSNLYESIQNAVTAFQNKLASNNEAEISDQNQIKLKLG